MQSAKGYGCILLPQTGRWVPHKLLWLTQTFSSLSSFLQLGACPPSWIPAADFCEAALLPLGTWAAPTSAGRWKCAPAAKVLPELLRFFPNSREVKSKHLCMPVSRLVWLVACGHAMLEQQQLLGVRVNTLQRPLGQSMSLRVIILETLQTLAENTGCLQFIFSRFSLQPHGLDT